MSSILGALALVIMCGSDLVQQIRVLPFDGMPMQYYSIDVYGQMLCVDIANKPHKLSGSSPKLSRGAVGGTVLLRTHSCVWHTLMANYGD